MCIDNCVHMHTISVKSIASLMETAIVILMNENINIIRLLLFYALIIILNKNNFLNLLLIFDSSIFASTSNYS